MKKPVLFFLLIVTLFNCSKPREQEVQEIDKNFLDSLSLKPVSNIALPIDSLTSNSIRSIKYLDTDSEIYLLNSLTNTIEIFDLNKRLWKKRIQMDIEGPDGIGSASYIIPISQDSLLVFSKAQQLSIINGEGRLIKKYSPCYNRQTGEGSYLLAIVEITPIKVKNDVFFIATNAYDPYEKKSRFNNMNLEKNIAQLNLLTGECSYSFAYPDTYAQANGLWSSQYYDVKYHDYISEYGKFIISLPADENIYLTDYESNTKKYYAGSKLFDKIDPFYSKETLMAVPDELISKDFAINPSYQNIRYDKYRKLIYRVAELPYEEVQYEQTPQAFSGIKKWSLIILDENFQKKGEVEMPGLDLLAGSFLITEEGLLIYDYSKNQEDEDHINYVLYEITTLK